MLEAQQRTGSNDTVHLYDGTVEEKMRFGVDSKEVEPALCSGAPLYQPVKNNSEPVYEVGATELDEEEYLIRDDEVVGKFCGNCRKIVRGDVFT